MTSLVVGYGRWGRVLERNLVGQGDRVLVYDPAFKDGLASYEEGLAKADAVYIATPAETHHDLAVQAILAGKPVWLEKPAALSSRDVLSLTEVAASSRFPVFVNHLLLYHPTLERWRDDPTQAITSRRHAVTLRVEGALWSLGPHDVALAIELCGPPVAVDAATVTQNRAMARLRFESGATGVFEWRQAGDTVLRVFSRLGWFQGGVLDESDRTLVARALAHFHECLKTGELPRTDISRCLPVYRTLEAIERRTALTLHGPVDIDLSATVGEGTTLWHGSRILADTTVGDQSKIGQNVVIGPNVTIGARVNIQNNVSVYEGVTLEDEVFVGPSVTFTNVKLPSVARPHGRPYVSTLVKRGASLGANCTIVCGVTIGEHAMVGAGAVVTHDVPAWSVIIGNPGLARV